MEKRKVVTIISILGTVITASAMVFVGNQLLREPDITPEESKANVIIYEGVEFVTWGMENCGSSIEENGALCLVVPAGSNNTINKHWCAMDKLSLEDCNCIAGSTAHCDSDHFAADNMSKIKPGIYSPSNAQCTPYFTSLLDKQCTDLQDGDEYYTEVFTQVQEGTKVCLDRVRDDLSRTYCGEQVIEVLDENGQARCGLMGLMKESPECLSIPVSPTPTPTLPDEPTSTPVPPDPTVTPTVPLVNPTVTPTIPPNVTYTPTATMHPTVTVSLTPTPIDPNSVSCGPIDVYMEGESVNNSVRTTDYIGIRDFVAFAKVYQKQCNDDYQAESGSYDPCGGKNRRNAEELGEVNVNSKVDIRDFIYFAKVYKKDSCLLVLPETGGEGFTLESLKYIGILVLEAIFAGLILIGYINLKKKSNE